MHDWEGEGGEEVSLYMGVLYHLPTMVYMFGKTVEASKDNIVKVSIASVSFLIGKILLLNKTLPTNLKIVSWKMLMEVFFSH